MREVFGFFEANDAYFILGLSVLSLALLINTLVLYAKLGKLGQQRSKKLAEGHVGEIVDCLSEHADVLSGIRCQIDQISGSQTELSKELGACLRSIGIVRFDAFDDVGGEQSFALAMLDANKNGVIVSNIYGRQDSRLYAKGITNGDGERALSDEERRALEKALS